VERGDTVEAEIEVITPQVAGKYRLEVDMVEEGVCWFSERYAVALQIPVTVSTPRGILARLTSPFR